MANQQTPDENTEAAGGLSAHEGLSDEISSEELAALAAQLGTLPAAAAPTAAAPAPGETLGDMISEEELALLQPMLGKSGSAASSPPAPPRPPAPKPEPPKPEPAKPPPTKPAHVEPRLPELLSEEITASDNGLGLLLDVPLRVSIELGRVSMTLQQVLALGRGSIVELDRLAGEPVDILVNDKPIGRGEVVVVDEYFGVKITELIEPKG